MSHASSPARCGSARCGPARCGPAFPRWLAAAAVVLLLAWPARPAAAAPLAAPQHAGLAQSAYGDLDSPDPDVRAAAVQAIRAARDRAALPALMRHLGDPDQRVGLYIAQALIDLATPGTLLALRTELWTGNADARWRAAWVLGERKESRAISALVRGLRDEEVLVQRTAAEALAQIGSPTAVNALVNALLSPKPSIVHAAMRGLLAMGDEAVPCLTAALESGNPQMEKNAAIVLGTIGTRRALQSLR